LVTLVLGINRNPHHAKESEREEGRGCGPQGERKGG
jgi:hypothetical protein